MALDDGTVVLATGLFPDSAVDMLVAMASWLHETDSSRQGDQFELSFQPEEFAQGDPLEMFGAPIYNLLTASPVGQTTAPTPSAVEETPETPTPTLVPTPEPASTNETEISEPVEEGSSDEAETPVVVESPTSATAEATASTPLQTPPEAGSPRHRKSHLRRCC